MSRRRRARATLVLIVLAGAGLLVGAGLRDTVTYYRTPGEVLAGGDAAGARLRLGGRVVPGTLRQDGGQTRFRLTDGSHEIDVVQRGAPPDMFREGRDAVVEGVLGAGPVFRADTVLVRHGNEYRPAGAESAGTGARRNAGGEPTPG
ncbi:cytochrome c maturation protein CcmE [Micromonospora sp. NPDC049679]|uniref:cytochrome c maturation protein CcmE n=1 Tax=Micromonospora sp. NPDC049679 TaxID=3155920 RepID=UPI0033C12D73